MLYYSNAKINLGLNIIKKRKDGFHNLETVFYPIAVKDAMEFIPSDKVDLSNSGISVDCNLEDNLIIKAYRLLQSDFDLPTLKFHLHKTIPSGAGLGGGSANAVYTLMELNRFYKLDLSKSKLQDYASRLGSDCAFFIDNTSLFATGKGDVFQDVKLDLSGFHILLIHPNFAVSTIEAYSNVVPKQPSKSLLDIVNQPIDTWQTEMINDFEESVFKKYPLLSDIKTKLYREGAVYASMSGSGSSIFGIFRAQPNTDDFSEYWTWTGLL